VAIFIFTSEETAEKSIPLMMQAIIGKNTNMSSKIYL
jgi:hypothetical protein